MTAARRTTATGARTVQLGLAVVVTFVTASAMTVFGIGFGAAVLLAGRVAAALAGAAGLALVGDLVPGLAGDLVLGLAGGDDFGGDLRGERRVDTDRTMAMWFGRFPGKRGCRYMDVVTLGSYYQGSTGYCKLKLSLILILIAIGRLGRNCKAWVRVLSRGSS